MSTIPTKLVTAAAVGAAAIGGAAAATSSSSTGSADHGRHTVNGKSEQALTGTTASKVRAAALAKVPGTIVRRDQRRRQRALRPQVRRSRGGGPVSKDFTVAAVNAMGDHGGKDNDNDGPDQP